MSTLKPAPLPAVPQYLGSTNPKATIEGLISEALNVPRRAVYPDQGTKPSHVLVDNGSGGQILTPYYDALTSGKLEPGPTAQPLTPIEAEKQAMLRFMQTMNQPIPEPMRSPGPMPIMPSPPPMPPSTISDRPFVPSNMPAIPSIPFRDKAFGDVYSNIAPLPEGVAVTSPRNPNADFNKVTNTFDPYNGIQVDQSGKIVNAVQLGLGSDYQGSPQDVMNYLADRERQRAIAEDKAMYEINSRLVPAIDNRGGSTQPVAPSYPPNMQQLVPTMPQPMPAAPAPRLRFGYAAQSQMPAMPQPMAQTMPQITPMARPQITPMTMQNQAPMENLQPTSSRFDPAILQKLISSVPVRRRKKK